jgi:hypothetical protein
VRREGQLWLAKGRADWWQECRVSPKQADRALALLEDRGLIEVRLFRFRGAPTKHVRIRPDGFLSAWETQLAGGRHGDRRPGRPGDFTEGDNSICPEGEDPFAPLGNMEIPRSARSVTESTAKSTAQSTAAPAAGAAAAGDDLVAQLVAYGVGRAVARRLARAKPDVCRRCLEYLPHVVLRTTPGAWLANAIRDEYGPPEGFVRAQECRRQAAARQATGAAGRRRQAAQERGRREALRAAAADYRRLQAEGGPRLAAFEAFVARERARLLRVAGQLSPVRRQAQLAAFDTEDHRPDLYLRWQAAAAAAGKGRGRDVGGET